MAKTARCRTLRENATSYAFLVPWLLGFFVLTVYPMGYSLFLSFTQYNILRPPTWVGLRNIFIMFVGNDQLPRDDRGRGP